MIKFAYVEDYLEVINGDRDPRTGKLYGLFDSTPPIVSLARYDVQILASMSQATQDGKALTDKQADLAVKIILKYRKQLEKLEIDIGPIESPSFRLGIRQIDRRRLLYVDNDQIVLQFPYDTTLINDIRELSKLSQGSWAFDNNRRAWKLAITEANVVAANGFARNNQFEIDSSFVQYVSAIELCEQIDYKIELIQTDSGLAITNAPTSLNTVIHNWCGFDNSNCDLLVDISSVYGYSVSDSIIEQTTSKHGARVCNLMLSRELKFSPDSDSTVFEDVINFARITGRYPIYVYEPDMSDRLYKKFVEQYFASDDVHRVKDLKKTEPVVHKKVIYFTKYSAQWDQPVPLLISGQGMMHGGEKSLLLQRAEKVVYFATEVYNNKKTKPS